MAAIDTGFPANKAKRPQSNPIFAGRDFVLSGRVVQSLWVLLSGFLVIRLLAMVTVPFTDTTEARYGEIARKMVETGNWITPQFDYGVPFWGKPPLHTWLSAGGMELFGVSEFAARLPILLTAFGILALVYVWVAGILGRNAALLSIAVLSSMALFFGASAFVMTDMPMALGTTLVMIGFWNAVCREVPSRVWGMVAFAGMAVGMMAKGPVAVVIGLIPIVIWLTFRRRWGLVRHLPWAAGLTILIGLTAPWYIMAEIATPGFLRYFIIGEHFERFFVPGWEGDLYGRGHAEPKGRIWTFWLITALPWSFALIPLAFRGRRVAGTFAADRSGWLWYLLLWILSPLILFTPAANILAAYTLPGLPAAAILLTVLAGKIWTERPPAAAKGFLFGAAAVSLAGFGTLAVLAGAAPETLNLKSQKRLVVAARDYAGDGPIYMVGGRSYAGEFYTAGQARIIATADVATLAASPEKVAFSVPKSLAPRIEPLGFERIGEFGRRILYVRPGTEGAE